MVFIRFRIGLRYHFCVIGFYFNFGRHVTTEQLSSLVDGPARIGPFWPYHVYNYCPVTCFNVWFLPVDMHYDIAQ